MIVNPEWPNENVLIDIPNHLNEDESFYYIRFIKGYLSKATQTHYYVYFSL